ncbi:hypothetical protein JCM11491_004622 [Sporobolomyces phaffii]
MSSHSAAQDLQKQLLKFVSTIPRDDNPYLALAGYIKDLIVPNVPFSGLLQLYILAGLVGLTLLFVVASMLVRYFKGIFWIFQISTNPLLIRPHFSLSWSSVAVFMLALFEGYIFECVHLFQRDIRPTLGYWTTCTWIVPFIGGECAAWSLGVSYLTYVQASGGAREPTDRWARVSNYAGILSSVVYTAVMLPIALITGRHFAKAISAYLEMDRILRRAATTWTTGTPLNLAVLAPALPLVETLQSAQASLLVSWKATYAAYCVFTLTLVGTLTTIALLYLSALRRRIKQTTRNLEGIEGSKINTRQITRTYQTLQFTIGAFVILGTTFTVISAYSAAKPDALQQTATAQVLVLGPLYAFAVLGLPTSISLLWRAIDARPNESGKWDERSGTRSGGDGPKQYAIELGGRRKPATRTEVNVTVDVLVKEEGELEKWESLSNRSMPKF